MFLVQSFFSDLEQQEPLGCCFTPNAVSDQMHPSINLALTEGLVSNLKIVPSQKSYTIARVTLLRNVRSPKVNCQKTKAAGLRTSVLSFTVFSLSLGKIFVFLDVSPVRFLIYVQKLGFETWCMLQKKKHNSLTAEI